MVNSATEAGSCSDHSKAEHIYPRPLLDCEKQSKSQPDCRGDTPIAGAIPSIQVEAVESIRP